MQSNHIITVLSSDEGIRFLKNNLNNNPNDLALKYAGKTKFDLKTALSLLGIYKKAAKKIPVVTDNFLAIDQRSYEQSTSQKVAQFKAKFIRGKHLLDLTAGIGIDSIYLSQNFEQIEAVEINKTLHQLASFNLKKLGITNVKRIHGDSFELLSGKLYDWIYIDPDRRINGKRAVDLNYLEPDVLGNLALIKKSASKVYIKLSPLFDLSEIARCFKQLNAIYLIAEKNELKEVGVFIDYSIQSEVNNVTINLTDVSTNFSVAFSFDEYLTRKKHIYKTGYNKFLHSPSVLVAKSSCFYFFTKGRDVTKHPTFQLFFSENKNLPGFKTFEVIDKCVLSLKQIKKSLRLTNLVKVNIVLKGLNELPSKWHSKLGTKDGGDYFLFILKSDESEAIICKRIT